MSIPLNTYIIQNSHPSLSGHFPGHPIVPGVVILNYVIQELQQHYGVFRVLEISKIKFIKPLVPKQKFVIENKLLEHNTVNFSCVANQEIFVSGRMKFLPLTGDITA